MKGVTPLSVFIVKYVFMLGGALTKPVTLMDKSNFYETYYALKRLEQEKNTIGKIQLNQRVE